MNPWLSIPLDDYERHMEAVGQTAALRELFETIYARAKPQRLAVLGCTAGADFDVVDPLSTHVAVGLDVNPTYLQAAQQRSSEIRRSVKWVCGDVLAVELPQAPFDLIHAALLLEYVDAAALFRRVRRWLSPEGYLSIITQQPIDGVAAVSGTCYESLQSLSSTMMLRAAGDIVLIAADAGYAVESQKLLELRTGKVLVHSIFQADDDGTRDIPSPIDLRDARDASDWVSDADRKRPWRGQIRASIADLLRTTSPAPRRVLELGSGPGLLAEAILRTCSLDNYTLFDFSTPMLDMSRVRLANHASATFVCGDFKQPDWSDRFVGRFDAVVAMQAVHEIRHKRHVAGLYRQVRKLLRPSGLLVVCDHNPPDQRPHVTALHSTEAEQHAALSAAGFVDVGTHLMVKGLYVCTARSPQDAA